MPFDFDLPEDLLRYLGLDYYRINTGVYKIQDDGEYIIVDVWNDVVFHKEMKVGKEFRVSENIPNSFDLVQWQA